MCAEPIDHASPILSPKMADWFAAKGWVLRPHQADMIGLARGPLKNNRANHGLLIAPTGAGKTLAGFLPSLIELSGEKSGFIHTLYISPLKALAADIARNLSGPIAEMGLDIRVDVRDGDTSGAKRRAQLVNPPDILLTTPEQLALLVATEGAAHVFSHLKRIIIDEIHAFAPTKRGDHLALILSVLDSWAPMAQRVGLSATVADPLNLARWLAPQASDEEYVADIILGPEGPKPEVHLLLPGGHVPWAGHTGNYAIKDVYRAIKDHKLSLIFVNTRFQAELAFQELWKINDDGLPIALHHGALDANQKRKVEAAMVAGLLRAVVTTATLDMGIDWGDVDMVIQMGAPKGAARLVQRIGRSNHQLDNPSKALMVPSNRFEMLECRAAQKAIFAGLLDEPPARFGALDVLCQHILGRIIGQKMDGQTLYDEVIKAEPYSGLSRSDFDDCLGFVRNGGYGLGAYERFQKLVPEKRISQNGAKSEVLTVRHPDIARDYRLNIGTILEADMLKVQVSGEKGARAAAADRPNGGRIIGQLEAYFIETLSFKDNFLFGGEVWRLEGVKGDKALVSRSFDKSPKIPSWMGGTFPLSTFLAAGVRALIANMSDWHQLEPQVQEWLEKQAEISAIPSENQLLIEAFPRGNRFFMCLYPFEGRLAHQTLALLLTKRLERVGLRPLGFAINDYAIAIWAGKDLAQIHVDELLSPDILADDLEEWLEESPLMKRSFARVAQIAGMVAARTIEKGGVVASRKRAFSTDLIFDVLRTHQPNHVLMRAARIDAAEGLLEIDRLAHLLKRPGGYLIFRRLDEISPFAVPLMLEITKVSVASGASMDDMLAMAATAPLSPNI